MHVCGRGALAAALLLAAGAPARVAGRQPPRDCATPPLTRERVQACLADAADLTAHRDSAAVLRLLEPMLGAASINGEPLPEGADARRRRRDPRFDGRSSSRARELQAGDAGPW